MSVCSCSYGGREVLGSRVSKEQTARKPGFTCPNCGEPVVPGQKCIDSAGLYGDDDGGFFGRFHPECWRLMILFSDEMCGGDYGWPFDLTEAAAHAVAHGDEPFWRDWLLLYEQTWRYGPEPPDPGRVG